MEKQEVVQQTQMLCTPMFLTYQGHHRDDSQELTELNGAPVEDVAEEAREALDAGNERRRGVEGLH